MMISRSIFILVWGKKGGGGVNSGRGTGTGTGEDVPYP